MCANSTSAAIFALYANPACAGPPLSTQPFSPASAGLPGWGCVSVPGTPSFTYSSGVCVAGPYTPAAGVGYSSSAFFPAPSLGAREGAPAAAKGVLRGALADPYCPVPQAIAPYSVTALPVGTCFAPYTTAFAVSQLVGCSGGLQTTYQFNASA